MNEALNTGTAEPCASLSHGWENTMLVGSGREEEPALSLQARHRPIKRGLHQVAGLRALETEKRANPGGELP
jgi:hypothetical protein